MSDDLLVASDLLGTDLFELRTVSVPDRSAVVGLDTLGRQLITYDSSRGVFKRNVPELPIWTEYLSIPDIGRVLDFTVDADGNLLVLVDRPVVPTDFCGTNQLNCNSKTTRCVASLTAGACLCLPGFSSTPLADNFCLPGCQNETCSDGTCVLNISECPPVQACSPSRPRRCPHGECVVIEEKCTPGRVCGAGLQLCIDGACRKDCSTTPFAGCPRYTCPDGSCASRYDNCKGCNESSCTGTPPTAVFPSTQSFRPYSFAVTTTAFTIGLPSISVDSDHVLAWFSFPDRFVDRASAVVSFAEASSLKYRDNFNQRQIASKIVTVSIDNSTSFEGNVAASFLVQIPDGRVRAQLLFPLCFQA